MRILAYLLASSLLVVLTGNSFAQGKPPRSAIPEVSSELLQLYNRIGKDRKYEAKILDQVSLRTDFCFSCHGKTGNSERFYIPRLAGQNEGYLLEQLYKFSVSKRYHYVMVPLASSFEGTDIAGLARFFSKQKNIPRAQYLKKDELNLTLAKSGKELFQEKCAQCHGKGGKGNQRYARLAGQHPSYIESQLLVFRSRGKARPSTPMQNVSRNLTDHQILALANYAASL